MEKFIDGFDPNLPEYRLMRLISRMKPLRLGDFPHNRYDLSFSQMELIRYVGIFPGCHLQDLAEGLALTSPTVSVGIRRLVKDGWIERVPDPTDGRATCHYLTPKSQKVLQGAAQAMVAGVRVFLEQLNTSEQEQLFGLLAKAIEGVETLQQESKNKENYGE